jgi:predicted tellurium resistance membrane protein TerC
MQLVEFLAPHFAFVSDPTAWVALLTLVVLEIVLGIDNLIFISILTNKLPEAQRARARRLGISAALVIRLILLATISVIVQLTTPVFTALGHGFSWRDLILIAGGLFLLWKATSEIHQTMSGEGHGAAAGAAPAAGASIGVAAAIVQILLPDLAFSIDSILTAVGMTDQLPVMFAAVIVAVGVMMVAADPLANFIARNPTVVMLALGFLLMIGMVLIAEAFGVHVPRGYIYTAMAFSAGVETLNIWSRNARAKRQAK